MTDKQFKKKLDVLQRHFNRYYELLLVCEAEYEKRFGYNPSELEDDFWIDQFHVIGGGNEAPSIETITEHALVQKQYKEKGAYLR